MHVLHDGDDLDEQWRALKRGCAKARERLIVDHLPLVAHIARRLGGSLPSSVELADLISLGTLGLMDAIERFDADRGVQFSSYAAPRIRGAILDDLRRHDWAPKTVRTRGRALESAENRLTSELRRHPSDDELAAELQLTAEELQHRARSSGARTVVSLDESVLLPSDDGDSVSMQDTLPDQYGDEPGVAIEVFETKQELLDALRTLPPRLRLLVKLHYFEGRTMAAIGEAFGVTVSRVSQLHTQALLALRRGLADVSGETSAA
jgi:RNA polymerase sigma factor for flagellar operon FliA